MPYTDIAADGYPAKADSVFRAYYPPIPSGKLIYRNAWHRPIEVEMHHGWEWSEEFRQWRALIEYDGGKRLYTTPTKY